MLNIEGRKRANRAICSAKAYDLARRSGISSQCRKKAESRKQKKEVAAEKVK